MRREGEVGLLAPVVDAANGERGARQVDRLAGIAGALIGPQRRIEENDLKPRNGRTGQAPASRKPVPTITTRRLLNPSKSS
jgi:hypothetical protein